MAAAGQGLTYLKSLQPPLGGYDYLDRAADLRLACSYSTGPARWLSRAVIRAPRYERRVARHLVTPDQLDRDFPVEALARHLASEPIPQDRPG